MVALQTPEGQGCQPTAGLTSTCPQSSVKDLTTNLRLTCGQHIESPSRCWPCRPELLYVGSYSTFSWCWVAPIPYPGRKFLSHRDRTTAAFHSTSSKQYALNRVISMVPVLSRWVFNFTTMFNWISNTENSPNMLARIHLSKYMHICMSNKWVFLLLPKIRWILLQKLAFILTVYNGYFEKMQNSI